MNVVSRCQEAAHDDQFGYPYFYHNLFDTALSGSHITAISEAEIWCRILRVCGHIGTVTSLFTAVFLCQILQSEYGPYRST